MRYYQLIYLGLCFSCSAPAEESNSENIESNHTDQVQEDIIAEEEIEVEPNLIMDFYIEDMPSDWQHLEYSEENGEDLIMYHYCEAEVPSISFQAEKGDDWTIYTGHGQDGEIRTVQNFSGASNQIDGVEIVTGKFEVINNGEDNLMVTFEWSKESMICEFKGLGYSPGYFIPTKNADLVEHIEEDCEDLWD